MSYANLVLYLATLPSYENAKEKHSGKGDSDKSKEPTINADDPENQESIRKILFG